MTEQQLDCALDLMRRLPPQEIEKNLSDLIDLVPDLCEDLLSSVDQPLKIARDKQVGKVRKFNIQSEEFKFLIKRCTYHYIRCDFVICPNDL